MADRMYLRIVTSGDRPDINQVLWEGRPWGDMLGISLRRANVDGEFIPGSGYDVIHYANINKTSIQIGNALTWFDQCGREVLWTDIVYYLRNGGARKWVERSSKQLVLEWLSKALFDVQSMP